MYFGQPKQLLELWVLGLKDEWCAVIVKDPSTDRMKVPLLVRWLVVRLSIYVLVSSALRPISLVSSFSNHRLDSQQSFAAAAGAIASETDAFEVDDVVNVSMDALDGAT